MGPLPNVFNIKEKTHAVLAIKAEKKNDRREEGVEVTLRRKQEGDRVGERKK
jgi:hypothetical protein